MFYDRIGYATRHAAHLLLLIRSLNFGGAERQLVALACGLKQAGLSPSVCSFYGGGPLEADLVNSGIPLLNLHKQSRWDVFSFSLRLIRLVRNTRPIVLHSYLPTGNIPAVILKLFCARLKVVWGIRVSNMKLEYYGWLDRLLYWLECRLSRFADMIIANSRSGRDYAVEHGFPSEKMIVIPNGIDVDRFCPDLESRRSVRSQWKIKDGQLVIGLVGRLDPMKGHETFLRAAARVAKCRDDVRFICVGDGPEQYRIFLKQRAESLSLAEVQWLAARTDVESIYHALDVLALCSSYGEGFSNVLGEAMACGVPCIATDVGDSGWIIGETGKLVPPGSVDALSAAMLDMVEMTPQARAALGQAARQRIADQFGIARMIQDTSKVLLQIIDNRSELDHAV